MFQNHQSQINSGLRLRQKSIIENHYVDDFVDSFDSEDEFIEVSKSIIKIQMHGEFELRNFK